MFKKGRVWRWVSVRNDAGEDIPPYAALMVTGYDPDSGAVTVEQPDGDSLDPALVLVNGPMAVPAGAFGQASQADPTLALTDGDCVAGDDLGTAAGEWALATGNAGFVAWADADDDGLALANRAGGGSGGASLARVTGRPYLVDGVEFHPAVRVFDDAAGLGYHDGPAVWLVNANGDPMDTRGLVKYEATRKLKAYTLTDCGGEAETREVWRTVGRIVVGGGDFGGCPVYYTGVDEGEAVCDFMALDSGEGVTLDSGELVGLG